MCFMQLGWAVMPSLPLCVLGLGNPAVTAVRLVQPLIGA